MLLQRTLPDAMDDSIDLTPMVDIVFQVMTFLLLTYQMSADAEVEMPEARYGVGVEQSNSIILTLAPAESADGPVRIYAGPELSPEARLDSPEAIKSAVEAGLAEGRRNVVLQADGAVDHGEVIRVGSIVAEVEGVTLNIGVQDPK